MAPRRVLCFGAPSTEQGKDAKLQVAEECDIEFVTVPSTLATRPERLDWIATETAERGGFEVLILFFFGIPQAAPLDPELFLSLSPTLKVVLGPGAGYDKIPTPFLTTHQIYYANTPHAVSEPTATHTLILILTTLRGTTAAERSLRRGEWKEGGKGIANTHLGTSQVGLRLGIVGMGNIGVRVAGMCMALGMKVAYYNRKRRPVEEEGGAVYVESLDELLKQTDVLSLHCPLTPATTSLISTRELALMPPRSFVINMARGPVIDEQALIESLKSGHTRGAGLDVFKTDGSEGIDGWLLESEKVTLTPHFAVNIDTLMPAVESEMLENVRSWAKTGVPVNAVNSW